MRGHVESAILRTLHYADIFDYALTEREVIRYLIGAPVLRSEIAPAVHSLIQSRACSISPDGFLTLPGRESLVLERARLHQQALGQKRRARCYALLLGYFPFVRMVALTGALAMENARDDDIDLFIVAAEGHLWTVRAAAVALVRLARLAGDQVCPNFLVTENRLAVSEENLYSAHEIVQMIPLYGFDVYERFRDLNNWALHYMPNAYQERRVRAESIKWPGIWFKALGERLLGTRPGLSFERWEMSRKIKKLYALVPPNADEVEFSAEACCGFTSGHGGRALAEFEARIREFEAMSVPGQEIGNALPPVFVTADA